LYPKNESEEEISESRKSIELRLEEAKMILENFQKTFSKIKKMYESVPNPDNELKNYYKQQEKYVKKLTAESKIRK
ncbi:MAG: hypothetical protein EAY69_05355, partial [Cytophagales bacterium]